jgi:hypothetical protein
MRERASLAKRFSPSLQRQISGSVWFLFYGSSFPFSDSLSVARRSHLPHGLYLRLHSYNQKTKRDREVNAAKTIMNRVAEQLFRESKEAVDDSTPGREMKKSILGGRDLLSLLIRANTAKDLPENQRLSDQDVLSRRYPLL